MKCLEDNQKSYVCPTCGESIGVGDDYFGKVTSLTKNVWFCHKCGQRLVTGAGECPGERNLSSINILDVQTPLGTLYPGIYIDLVRNGCITDAPLALVEYTETEEDVENGAYTISRIWGDLTKDEQSDRIIHRKVEDFFSTPGNSCKEMDVTLTMKGD